MARRLVYYIGIDPGFTGALAVLTSRGKYWVNDTPVTKRIIKVRRKKRIRREYDVEAMTALLRPLVGTDVYVAMEVVGARPNQGVRSMFVFGHGLGLWEGLLWGTGLVIAKSVLKRPTPTTWKASVMSLLKGRRNDKGTALRLAQQLFPEAPLEKKKDHGRAEALLLAYWLKEEVESGQVGSMVS